MNYESFFMETILAHVIGVWMIINVADKIVMLEHVLHLNHAAKEIWHVIMTKHMIQDVLLS